MITRWDLITKKQDMPCETFRSQWEGAHAGIITKSRLSTSYVQNFVTDSQQRGVAFPRVNVHADAFAEIWFNNLHDMMNYEAVYGAELAESYGNFASEVLSLPTIKNIVIPIKDKPLLKRVSFIKRLPHMSPEQFKYEWWNIHPDFIHQFKGIRGYCQSLILDRIINETSLPYDAIPFDGIVELYFDDLDSLNHDFSSEVGKSAQAHAGAFLEAISTYIVEPKFICSAV